MRVDRYLVIAVFLSPLLGVFLGSVFLDVVLYLTTDVALSKWISEIPDTFLSAGVLALFGLVFSIPCVLVFGLPVAFLLRRLKLNNVFMYGLFGFVGGIALLLILTGDKMFRFGGDLADAVSSVAGAGYGMFGIGTAVTFWFIAEYLPERKVRDSGT